MKAMIFAAGLGTRLKPYTNSMPKALVPVGGVPMIEILIKHLVGKGISNIIVNVHHFSDQVIDFLEQNKNFGADIVISDESYRLLDTGGGLLKASWFFDDNQPFLVQNVDIICDIDYSDLLKYHRRTDALVTVAVSRRETSRYFLFDDKMQLSGWENTKTGEVRMARPEIKNPERYAFSGIHLIDPVIFEFIKQDGKFSIVDSYLELAPTRRISGYDFESENWVDMGKPEELLKAELILNKMKPQP